MRSTISWLQINQFKDIWLLCFFDLHFDRVRIPDAVVAFSNIQALLQHTCNSHLSFGLISRNGQPTLHRPPIPHSSYAHIFRNDVRTALAVFATGFIETRYTEFSVSKQTYSSFSSRIDTTGEVRITSLFREITAEFPTFRGKISFPLMWTSRFIWLFHPFI